MIQVDQQTAMLINFWFFTCLVLWSLFLVWRDMKMKSRAFRKKLRRKAQYGPCKWFWKLVLKV